MIVNMNSALVFTSGFSFDDLQFVGGNELRVSIGFTEEAFIVFHMVKWGNSCLVAPTLLRTRVPHSLRSMDRDCHDLGPIKAHFVRLQTGTRTWFVLNTDKVKPLLNISSTENCQNQFLYSMWLDKVRLKANFSSDYLSWCFYSAFGQTNNWSSKGWSSWITSSIPY